MCVYGRTVSNETIKGLSDAKSFLHEIFKKNLVMLLPLNSEV